MFRRLAACAFLVGGLLAWSTAVHPAWANSTALLSFCGACTKDDACGTDHKCCTSNCTDGKKKCLRVATCP